MSAAGVVIKGDPYPDVLTPEAVAFVAGLERKFGPACRKLLEDRVERQKKIDAGELMLGFLPETKHIRDGDWKVAPPSPGLLNRRVEITGPTDAKMSINALNSGASGWMSDFEDSNTPTWANLCVGQRNLMAAVRRTLTFDAPDGKEYRLKEQTATLLNRPRGLHLPEKHFVVDGTPMVGALFDFGVFCFHNAKLLSDQGKGPFFYLPKLESHHESGWWDSVLSYTEEALGIPHGTMKATVLLETFPAAFEMDEILYSMRDHSPSLNAGRWDYLFSAIKTFKHRKEFLLPDRNSVTMVVPFMKAYTELLVKTCHKRGAHAMGGMAAFIPSRRDQELNKVAMARIHADKKREAEAGYDGTWVAHPDLVPIAMEEFNKVLGTKDHQIDRQRDDVHVTAEELLDFSSAGTSYTEAGLRNSINVTIQYLSSWLRGNGAAAIFNLMEDVATAEISRSQVWHWIRHGVVLENGKTVTAEYVKELREEELASIRKHVGEEFWAKSRVEDALAIFDKICLAPEFVDFLTIPAYDYIN
ncbi:malate synthase A [Hyaloraphidium curvatum]|nr:malate synthase A [Hyaloraphidium curvatum]